MNMNSKKKVKLMHLMHQYHLRALAYLMKTGIYTHAAYWYPMKVSIQPPTPFIG